MARVLCCRSKRPAKRFWLRTRKPAFDYELLFIGFCPNCKKDVMYEAGYKQDGGPQALHRIPFKDHDSWRARLNVDLLKEDQPVTKGPKETRSLVYVSEYTLFISRDPAGNQHRVEPGACLCADCQDLELLKEA